MIPVRWVHELRADPRPKLFGYASPGPVRVWSLRLLEERANDDFLVRHALRDARRYEPLRELLDCWRPEGHWGVERLYMRSFGEQAAEDRALLQAIRNLHLLHLYCWRGEGGYLPEAAELILDRSRPDGYLQFVSADSSLAAGRGRGRGPSFLRSDHWPGVAAAALAALGVEDRRLDDFYGWLERTQRDDGGWLPKYLADRLRPSGGDAESHPLPSHPLHTVNFAWALSAHPRRRESGALRRAAEFLLETARRFIDRGKSAPADRLGRLACPQWGFDGLKALRIALDAGCGPEHEGVRLLAEWLVGEQKTSGLWHGRGRRPLHDEDLFVTMWAVAALKSVFDRETPDGE